MDLIAARAGGRREFRQGLEAFLACLSIFETDIDPAEVQLGRCGLHAQRAAREGRLGHEPAEHRKYRQRRSAEDRDPQSSTFTTRTCRCRLSIPKHLTLPPGARNLHP